MADDNENQTGPYDGPYLDSDLQVAKRIGNFLNPPQPQAAATAPTPAMPPPQVSPSPAAVTRTGDPSQQKSKTWADYVRGSLDRATAAQDQSQASVNGLQNQPSVTSQNTPLEQQRTAAAQPIDPNQQQYKPGIGTRIVRGIDAFRRGGVFGVVDPADVGGQAYGAPNRQYGRDVARQQQDVGNLDQQMKENVDVSKADSDRLGKIATEQRAGATTALDIGKTATAQQGVEDRGEQNAALDKLRQERDEAKANKLPSTFEGTVVAAAMEQDPRRKKALDSAVQQMKEMEIKKFTYAQRASGGGSGPNEDKRQPMIDEATAQIQKLNDFAFDPNAFDGRGGFYDPANDKKVYSPEEFTDMKNQISTKLDAQLAKAKLRPLGVRFGVKATTPGVNPDGSLAPPGGQKPAAPAQTAPQQAPTQANQKATIQDGGGKPLTDAGLARQYLAKAGGDKEKARQLAKQDRWQF